MQGWVVALLDCWAVAPLTQPHELNLLQIDIGVQKRALESEMRALDFDYVVTLDAESKQGSAFHGPNKPANLKVKASVVAVRRHLARCAQVMHLSFDDPVVLAAKASAEERTKLFSQARDKLKAFVEDLPSLMSFL
jgi:hypothetical protein